MKPESSVPAGRPLVPVGGRLWPRVDHRYGQGLAGSTSVSDRVPLKWHPQKRLTALHCQ